LDSLESVITYLSDNLGSVTFKWSGTYDKVIEISTVGPLENKQYSTMFRCPAGMETEAIIGAVEDHKMRVKMNTEEI